MNASPNPDLLERIAIELGVDPSLVEKDWHGMRLVGVLVGFKHDVYRLVFSGGTCLSKGHGLIQRFSEDLDFKVSANADTTRPDRRNYRDDIVEVIRTADDWTLDHDDITTHDDYRFFRCQIGYRNIFSPADALRPEIRLEMRFGSPALPVETLSLRSFVAEARQEDAEVKQVACVSPVETAADKLSALTWRVLTRDRASAGDDPSLVRHLHDLVALQDQATGHSDFPELLNTRLVEDEARVKASPEIIIMTPADRLDAAFDILTNDPLYPGEYERFVLNMSYAPDAEQPQFDTAVAATRHLAGLLQ